MNQFCVYENLHVGTKGKYPYFLNVQHTLHERLESRLVIPLVRNRKEFKGLTLTVLIDDETLVASVAEMLTVSVFEMGKKVGDLSDRSGEIINMTDFLITGF